MKRALSVASECAGLIKTGGLADVVAALPAALADYGWELRTLLPGYPVVLDAIGSDAASVESVVLHEPDLYGGAGRVLSFQAHGLDLLVLDAPHLFQRDGGPYTDAAGGDWPDNAERFCALGRIAARIAGEGVRTPDNWRPSVLHLHDWQAGFTTAFVRGWQVPVGTLMTVHNIAFHGITDPEKLDTLQLPRELFHIDGIEYFGKLSALKSGLMLSDWISTVSPTYARELRTPEFGMGLEGVLRKREAQLSGILNGIDERSWDPRIDREIRTYDSLDGKRANRDALLSEFGLDDTDGPLAVVVSRLTDQKGLDVLLRALPTLTARGGNLVLLGSGMPALEYAFQTAAERDPRVAVRIGYDEALAHRMIAGGDAILVPSRFEPCGLTQLYGLHYGTLPVVSRTGGLADSVIDANDAALRAGVATGIHIAPITPDGVRHALARLCDLYNDHDAFRQIQRRGMAHDVSWKRSAAQYAALYDRVTAS